MLKKRKQEQLKKRNYQPSKAAYKTREGFIYIVDDPRVHFILFLSAKKRIYSLIKEIKEDMGSMQGVCIHLYKVNFLYIL